MGRPGRITTQELDFRPGGPKGNLSHTADIRLRWDKVNSSPAVNLYQIQSKYAGRVADPGPIDWTSDHGVIHTESIPADQFSYTENQVVSSRRYFHVRARNADGWGDWSPTVNMAPPFPPRAPTILSAQYLPPKDMRIICSTPEVSGDFSGITGYYLQLSYTEDFSTPYYGGVADVRDITTAMNRYGVEYFFRMRAKNIAGDGRWSNIVSYLHAPGPRVNVEGEWRNTVPYINVNGVWRVAIPYVNGVGVWRLAARSN